MPITGRQPKECFRTFRDHLGPLIAATLGPQHHVHCQNDRNDDTRSTLSLGPTNANGVRLRSSTRGDFVFSLQQSLKAVKTSDAKLWQLKTAEYRYAIYETDDDLAEASLRWEYIARPPLGRRWCKHHFQIGRRDQKAVELPFNGGVLDLNRVHNPTGFVLIEYVLRFVLTDMGVQAASDDWEEVLEESEGRFFREFSGRTSVPPR